MTHVNAYASSGTSPPRLNVGVTLPPRDLHEERKALERITLARHRRDNPDRTHTVIKRLNAS